MPRVRLTANDFPNRVLLRGFEGGAVYTAEQAGKFYVILDESTMADLLSEEDLAGMNLVTVLEFTEESERAACIHKRGWSKSKKEVEP